MLTLVTVRAVCCANSSNTTNSKGLCVVPTLVTVRAVCCANTSNS